MRQVFKTLFIIVFLSVGLNYASTSFGYSRIIYSGSAFFVTPDGYAITARHVTNKGKQLILVVNGVEYPARVIRVDPSHDIALVKVDLKTSYLQVASSAQQGESVTSYGYPSPQVFGFYLHTTSGYIAAVGGPGGQSAEMVHTCEGNSGGALVGSNGVVGVTVAGSTLPGYRDGDICANLSFSVDSKYVIALMRSAGVNIPSSGYSPGSSNVVLVLGVE